MQLDQQSGSSFTTGVSRAIAPDPSVEPTVTPLWREMAWPLEWWKLVASPVYLGCGVPRGNGEPVVLVPGFLSGDIGLLELHRWLRRIGYRSYLSHVVWNTDCPDETARRLISRLRALRQHTGQSIRLVGHSLGGLLAKSVVQDEPDLVDRVITLGSPFRSLVKAHPTVLGFWDDLKLSRGRLIGRNLKSSCGTGHCMCSFVRNLMQPRERPVPQYAVFSRRDGVVDWSSCVEEDPAANTEVDCTHIGMIVHPDVYRAVAVRLAQKEN